LKRLLDWDPLQWKTSEASAGLREKMYRVLILMLLLVGLTGASPYFSDDKDNNATGRLLTGKVLDNRDNPVPGAVVHLTNTHTQAVKTYIARQTAHIASPDFPSILIMKSMRNSKAR
jgi:hypothetical protein